MSGKNSRHRALPLALPLATNARVQGAALSQYADDVDDIRDRLGRAPNMRLNVSDLFVSCLPREDSFFVYFHAFALD